MWRKTPTAGRTLWRVAGILSLSLAILALTGCQTSTDPQIDRQELEQVLRAFLPKLAEAYATGNTDLLTGLAVDKEKFRVRLRIDELVAQGMSYEPEFKDLTIEHFNVWSYSNAVVTTREVWDLRSYSLGSHILLSEILDQQSLVKYQLKRKEAGWMVLYRELDRVVE